MPQYNQSTVLNGQYIDPTFGIATLNKESEEKDKARMRQAAATKALQRALSTKGLLGTAQVRLGENGVPEFQGTTTGMTGGELEAKYHNIGYQDNSIIGKQGKVSSDTIDRSGEVASANRAQDFQAQANLKQMPISTYQQQLATGGLAAYPTLPPNATTVGNTDAMIKSVLNAPSPIANATPTSSALSVIPILPSPVKPIANQPIAVAPSTSMSITKGIANSAEKHLQESIDTGSISSSGSNYRTRETYDDGGNVNDNVRMDYRDLLAASFDSTIQEIYGGGSGLRDSIKGAMDQSNRVNDQINAANARQSKSTEISAEGTYSNQVSTGSRTFSTGQNQSSNVHTGDNIRGSGQNPNEEEREIVQANGTRVPTVYNKKTGNMSLTNGTNLAVTSNSLTGADTIDKAAKIYKDYWTKQNFDMEMVPDPSRPGSMVMVDKSAKGNFKSADGKIKGKAFARLVDDGSEQYRDSQGNIVDGHTLSAGQKDKLTKVYHVVYFDENDPQGNKVLEVPERYIIGSSFQSATRIGGGH